MSGEGNEGWGERGLHGGREEEEFITSEEASTNRCRGAPAHGEQAHCRGIPVVWAYDTQTQCSPKAIKLLSCSQPRLLQAHASFVWQEVRPGDQDNSIGAVSELNC